MSKIGIKRRYLPILLAGISLMFTAAAVNASEMETVSEPDVYVSGEVEENITWSLADGVLNISGTGEMEETPWLDCREEIKTVIIREGITHIAPYAFMECPALTSITFPNTVVSFGDHAVNHCPELKEVTLPASVRDFDVAPFEGSGLLNIYVDEENPYYTSVDGVLYTKDKTILMAYPAGRTDTEYTVPEGTERIFCSAFQYSNLETINLPSTLTEIDEWVFARCKALSLIEIPAGVNSVGECAFIDVPTLISVKFTGMLPYVGDDAFAETSEGFEILYPENISSWADVITEDADGAEWWYNGEDCWRMKGYTSDTVLEGNYREGSIEGTEITWAIGYDGTLTISGTGEIPDYEHEGNIAPWLNYRGAIRSIKVGLGDGDNITRIGSVAFHWAINLAEIEISDSVKSIGYVALDHTGLTSFTLPASVEHLDDGALSCMYENTEFTVEEGNKFFTAIDGGIYTIDGTELVAYPVNSPVKSLVLPESVKRIWAHALQKSKLESVVLNEGLEEIDNWAFAHSTELTSVVFPASIKNLHHGAFAHIGTLECAKFEGMIPAFDGDVFYRDENLDDFVIYHPNGYGWTTEPVWQPEGNPEYRMEAYGDPIDPNGIYASGAIEDTDITWMLTNSGVLNISGTGEIPDYEHEENNAPWLYYRSMIRSIKVGFGVDDNITRIGDFAFFDTMNLLKVEIADTVKELGNHMFIFSGLSSFTLPASIENLDHGALTEMLCIERYDVEEGNAHFVAVDGVIYTADMTELVAYPPNSSAETFTVPASVEVIWEHSFQRAYNLKEVILNNGLEQIGDNAFVWVENLTSITIPASVNYLGHGAFEAIPSLEWAKFEGGTPSFGDNVFYRDDNLDDFVIYHPDGLGWTTEPVWQPEGNPEYRMEAYGDPIDPNGIYASGAIEDTDITWMLTNSGVLNISGTGEIPDYEWDGENVAPWLNYRGAVRSLKVGCGEEDNITYIGNYSFCGLKNLKEIDIADTVTKIGHRALADTGLTAFTLPASIEELDGGALAGMYQVKKFEVESANPFYKAIDGILYSADGTELVAIPLNADTETLVIPESVKIILQQAVQDADHLTSVVFNEGLEEINNWAFEWTDNLTSVTLPASLKSLGYGAFSSMNSLEWAKFEGMVPAFDGDVFYRDENLDDFVIYHPNGYGWTTEPTWQPADNPEYRMEAYGDPIDPNGVYVSGAIEDTDITWTLTNGGALTISGTGEIPDYDWDIYDAPWTPYRNMITSVSIGDGITGIGEHSLRNISGLTKIVLPSNIKYIARSAFEGCENLETINLPEGLEWIGHKAFADTAISDITIPASVYHLDSGALAKMHNVSAYKVAEGSEHFMADERGAVYHIDRGLADWFEAYPPANTSESYEIPVGVYAIGDCAFDWCKNLKTVTLPYTLNEIWTYTFSECTSLTSVYFRAGMPAETGNYIFGENPNEDLVLYFPYGSEGWETLTEENPEAEWLPNEINYSYKVRGYSYKIPDTVLDSGTIGDISWNVAMKDGICTLTISGTGEIPDYDWDALSPWNKYCGMISSISIGENITKIGMLSFGWCDRLTEMDIPANVKIIGAHAFAECRNLETLTLHEGLEVICHKAFEGTAISDITIPASVYEIHDGALALMYEVSAYKVAEGSELFTTVDGVLYTKDGEGLVAYPTGRAGDSYTVLDGVVDIWGHAFEQVRISSVTLPESLRGILGCAFNGSSLTETTIPANVEYIETYAFDNCENLTVIRFYGDMPYIGEGFNGVPESFRIVCRADMEEWAYSEFAQAGILRYFGDVSGDGVLNQSDADLLNRYFAGWKLDIDTEVLDFDTDGEVTRKDAMLLARTVAGWPGSQSVILYGNIETQEIAEKYNSLSVYVDRDSAEGPEGKPGEGVKNLFDNNKRTKYCLEVSGEIEVTVDFKQAHPVKAYMFRTGDDTLVYSERNPDSWALYGRSGTSDEWVLLDEVTDGEASMGPTNLFWYGFEVDEPVAYQCYKFVFRETGIMQLSEIQFLGEE